jgi:hypothetical protein
MMNLENYKTKPFEIKENIMKAKFKRERKHRPLIIDNSYQYGFNEYTYQLLIDDELRKL